MRKKWCGVGICLLNALKIEAPVFWHFLKGFELCMACFEIEGAFSCLSLPLLTGVKGLERSQKDREEIIKREGKENDRSPAFFFLMGASLRSWPGTWQQFD
jgi:hypothetical protein